MSSHPQWRTAWQGQDIVVWRDDEEVDRIAATSIERVVFIHAGAGESAGDMQLALVQTGEDWRIFRAETGFAGRVNFERLEFWGERECVYWVPASKAALPMRLRRGRFWLAPQPGWQRVPLAELLPLVDGWPLEGPMTWEQRKWRRIERSRPFPARGEAAHRAAA